MLSRLLVLWRPKLLASLAILVYYLLGYFTLNRFVSGAHLVPTTAADRLPIVPWTIVVYHTAFLYAPLAIWLHTTRFALQRFTFAVYIAYTINFILFAGYPTAIYRPHPGDDEGGFFLWLLELTRELDRETTCFPSLHMTNAFLGVFAHWGGDWRPTRLAVFLWIWTLVLAVTTLTTGQHVFLDLPAGALVALVGWHLAVRSMPREDARPDSRSASRPGSSSGTF